MYTYQVKFRVNEEEDEDVVLGGIYVENGDEQYIICGCCGSVFDADEVCIVEKYEDWFDLSEEIKWGNEI